MISVILWSSQHTQAKFSVAHINERIMLGLNLWRNSSEAEQVKPKEDMNEQAATMANQLVSWRMSFTFSRSSSRILASNPIPFGLKHFSCRVINIIIVVITPHTHTRILAAVRVVVAAVAAAKRQYPMLLSWLKKAAEDQAWLHLRLDLCWQARTNSNELHPMRKKKHETMSKELDTRRRKKTCESVENVFNRYNTYKKRIMGKDEK